MSAQRQYELVYIASPESTEQDMADLHAQVEGIVARFSGTIDKTENWGRRKLAYEINHHKEGIYALELITGPGEMVRELNRRLRVTDRIVRHLIVRVDEELRVAERAKAARAEQVAARRAARGLPPEPAADETPAEGTQAEAGQEPASAQTETEA